MQIAHKPFGDRKMYNSSDEIFFLMMPNANLEKIFFVHLVGFRILWVVNDPCPKYRAQIHQKQFFDTVFPMPRSKELIQMV